jgi:hypothetical protein
MIRRNVAGQVIYLPQLTTTDGTPITASATLTVAKDGSEAGSGGTLAHVANGVWKYTPTQSETDAAIVGLILTGTNAVPVVLNLVTTAADTSAVALGANTTTPPTPNQIMAGLVTGSQPAGSLARFVRDIKQADVLFEGTIITATSNTATLNGDATTVCVGQAITIGEEGDIERQTRWVVAFDLATKIVTLDSPWCVVPPDGSDYQIKVLRRSLTQAAVDAILTIDEKIDDLTELDDGDLRFTAKALEQGPSGGGGGGDCGDATEAKQDAILAALTTADIRRVALPIQDGTLAIVQGDTYDDIAQPKARFATERDFTDGWTVTLTIRDKDDAVVYSVAGVVENDESIAIAIIAPTGLPMTGCPGVWEGKFDVEVRKGASVVTIERGPAYVYEDQTR